MTYEEFQEYMDRKFNELIDELCPKYRQFERNGGVGNNFAIEKEATPETDGSPAILKQPATDGARPLKLANPRTTKIH